MKNGLRPGAVDNFISITVLTPVIRPTTARGGSLQGRKDLGDQHDSAAGGDGGRLLSRPVERLEHGAGGGDGCLRRGRKGWSALRPAAPRARDSFHFMRLGRDEGGSECSPHR